MKKSEQANLPGVLPPGFKFQTQYARHNTGRAEPPSKIPSLTIPDQTLTIPQILKRFSNGLGFGGGLVPLYNGGSDVLDGVNAATLDLVEKFNIYRAALADHEKLRSELEAEFESRAKDDLEKRIADEVERRLKEKEAPQA